mmetsp:Transcript_110992/g.220768  ORF Transcript_110992/g.220768 Transcript_110992/m.220768 type:complete len:326 (-) Transcript_110992:67-1044(-)
MCTPACRTGPGASSVPDAWEGLPFCTKREDVHITFRGRQYEGRLVAEADVPPRPLVIIIHNFQGLKTFDEQVAEYMARIGYVGLAIDTYGDAVPKERRPWPVDEKDVVPYMNMCFSEHFKTQNDWEGSRQLLKLWLDAGLANPSVDSSQLPVIVGYCYGGGMGIEAIRGGLPVAGVVSLHGVPGSPEYKHNPCLNAAFCEKYGLTDLVKELSSTWQSPKNDYNTEAVVFVEHGLNDDCVPASMLQDFVDEFNSAGVDMALHAYASTPHGFTLPPCIGPPGSLHERSDRRATLNILELCREVWPFVPQRYVPRNAAGTSIPSVYQA